MRTLRTAAAIAMIALLASCAPRRAPPEPAPPPQPAPPPPTPAPPPLAWQDAPLSAGDWSYRNAGGGSSAAFGTGAAFAFVLSCDAGRRISLTRTGAAGGNALIVRTSFGERTLPATAQAGGLVASLAASDPLLDQMVFSRGRFAVQAEGLTLLILPAWPEPARVIEDCRG